MNYYIARAECDRLNQQVSQADLRYANTAHVPDFCRYSGNCLIFGGSPALRSDFTAEKVLAEARKAQYPVIVLTSSDLLCSRLQQEAENRRIDAFITNRRYPNYEFFRGWSRARIAEFFGQISADAASEFYANAFLDILAASRQPLTLTLMRQLAAHSDAEIATIGRNARAPGHAVSVAANSPQEANRFRSDLSRFCSAVRHLVPREGRSGYSLSEPRLRNGFVYLIDMRSPHPNLLYQYFSEELLQVLSVNSHVLIIGADVNLNQDTPLLKVFETAQSMGATIGVSAENAGSVRERSIRFRANVLLMDETSSNQRLKDDLKTFGSGPYYFPKYVGSSIFRWRLSNAWDVGFVFDRETVPIGSASGMRAILQGDHGIQVTIARNLSLSGND